MGFAPPPRGGFAFVAAPGRGHARTVLSRGEGPHPPNELSLHRTVNFSELRQREVRAEDRAGNAGNRSDRGNRAGGYSSPTNSSRGTPYAPASFVTVGM
jgi:hypothetical protein